MNNELENRIEAILFYKAEPVSRGELKSILKSDKGEIENAITTLKEKWNGGVCIVDDGDALSFMTSSSVSSLIESMRKEELERELGKASLETLTIVLYKGPVSRREIDFIRGVQSQYILRALVSRGLIERMERGGEGPASTREGELASPNLGEPMRGGYVYKPTHELLGFLGIKEVKDLPEYGTLNVELEERLGGILENSKDIDIKENESQ